MNRRQAKKRRCARGDLKGIKDLEIPDAEGYLHPMARVSKMEMERLAIKFQIKQHELDEAFRAERKRMEDHFTRLSLARRWVESVQNECRADFLTIN